MSFETLECWYTDPFALHEARWLSNGKPTKLVCDGEATSPTTSRPRASSLVCRSRSSPIPMPALRICCVQMMPRARVRRWITMRTT